MQIYAYRYNKTILAPWLMTLVSFNFIELLRTFGPKFLGNQSLLPLGIRKQRTLLTLWDLTGFLKENLVLHIFLGSFVLKE